MKKLLSLVLGLSLGLAIGELAASSRDRGGFPHFNGYVADPVLGVRLARDFDTAIAFRDNPVAAIHVNHQGYRGADWPEREGEVVIIGDSQVFGLGVADDQTAAAVLTTLRPWPVLNMGVPTYGPDEYLAMIDEVAPRKPLHVVMVVNFANDLFELGHPNNTRHVVLDGWALRGTSLPKHLDFPGRSWLFQRSHLIYAARRLLHVEDDGPPVLDEAPKNSHVQAPMPEVPPPLGDPGSEYQIREAALRERQEAEDDVALRLSWVSDDDQVPELSDGLAALRRGAQVGEIFSLRDVEGEQKVAVTAAWLRAAARLRDGAPDSLRKWLLGHPDHPQAPEAHDALKRLDKAKASVAALGEPAVVLAERASAFRGFLSQAAGRAAAAGASLTVVALPMDVQVDPAEFAKYGQPAQDLSATLGLLSDLCKDAAHLGVRCLDATPALRGAQPGAFLDGDLHMTPKGQAAFAAALADTLSALAPKPTRVLGLPEGRTPLPLELEWASVGEITVTGSTDANCKTQQIREYLRVDCRSRPTGLSVPPYETDAPNGPLYLRYDAQVTYDSRVLGMVVVEGPEDRLLWREDDHAELILPLEEGRDVTVDIFWTDHVGRLKIHPGASPLGAIEASPTTTPPASWADPYLGLETCPEGRMAVGTLGRCLALCNTGDSCVSGKCGDWLGLKLCL